VQAVTIAAFLLVIVILLKIYGRLERKGEATADVPLHGIEFPLEQNNSTSRLMIRFSVGLMAVGLAAALGLFFAGHPETPYVALFSVMYGLALIWSFRRMYAGVVELRRDRLIMRPKAGRQEYPWHDIDAIRLSTWNDGPAAERAMLRLFRVDLREPFVEVRLRHAIRTKVRLWGSDIMGTDITGIPTGLKTVRIFVVNPETVAALATQYWLEAGAPEAATA